MLPVPDGWTKTGNLYVEASAALRLLLQGQGFVTVAVFTESAVRGLETLIMCYPTANTRCIQIHSLCAYNFTCVVCDFNILFFPSLNLIPGMVEVLIYKTPVQFVTLVNYLEVSLS